MISIKYIVLGIKLLIIYSMLNTYCLILPTTASAATPTATPSGELKTKLQALQASIASKAAQIKADISKKLQNKSYVGFVKSKSESSLTIATKSGTKIISINQDTQYSSKTKITLKSLNNEDYVASLGDVDDTGVLTARKIVKLTPPTDINLQTVWGLVVGISGSEITITTKQGKTITVVLDKKTDFKYGDKESSVDDIKMNKGIIGVGGSPKTNYINARLVYIQPYSSAYNPKIASPSATPTASPSATPKKR